MISTHEITLHDGTILWTATKIGEYLHISKAAFTSYVSRGKAPKPALKLEATRLWNAEEVKTWHAQRPGAPKQLRN